MDIPRDHPLYPAFKKWADANVPGQMLTVYWECWLAGARYAREKEVAAQQRHENRQARGEAWRWAPASVFDDGRLTD